jgi:protein-disulfide isomerase
VDDVTARDQAKRRLFVIGGVVLAAIVIVAVVIAAGSGGGGSKKAATPGAATTASGLTGVKEVTTEFAGIPQSGNVLGKPDAPATLMVFADMQCPFCAEFENKAMPALIERYVRPGKLKIVFQPIVVLGGDSDRGARAVAAAAQQNKLFEYAAILYRNQGQENTGYLDTAFVKKIGLATPGLDATKLVNELKAAPVEKLLSDAQATATSGKVDSTPTFFVAKAGQTLEPLAVQTLTADAFTPKLDQLTR